MIESWVNANGIILPQTLRALGHTYVLLSRAPDHYSRHSPVAGGHPVLNLAEDVVNVETNDLTPLLDCARRLHAREAFDGVITSCDFYLVAAAHIARELGLPGASPEAMALAVRKDLVREACRRAGVASPQFRVAASAGDVTQFAADVGYPVVIKPVDLSASEKVALARDEDEAVRAFDDVMADKANSRGQPRTRHALVESFVPGDELCVETLSRQGQTTILGMSGKRLSRPPLFLELGSFTPPEIGSELQNDVARYVRSVLAAVGHGHGLAHVEVRLSPTGPVLIEVNPRMGGDYLSELYEHTTGVDIAALDVRLAIGEALELPIALPVARGSAALECLLPPRAGRIVRVEGAEELARDPRYPRVSIKPIEGAQVPDPSDNSSFIGFIIAVDPQGPGARDIARQGLERLRVVMQE
jgi:biotin carboxylase